MGDSIAQRLHLHTQLYQILFLHLVAGKKLLKAKSFNENVPFCGVRESKNNLFLIISQSAQHQTNLEQ